MTEPRWRNFRSTKIGPFRARVDADARYVPLLGERLVPSKFSVRVYRSPAPETDRRLRFYWQAELDAVVENGRARCVAVRRTREGQALTGTLLRDLSIDAILGEAVAFLAKERRAIPRARIDPFTDADSGEVQDVLAPVHWRGKQPLAQLRREYTKLARSRRRGRQPTDETLRMVAEVYRAADPRRPTETVRFAFDIPRSTAGRWVMEARRRGILGPAPDSRRAGEAAPST